MNALVLLLATLAVQAAKSSIVPPQNALSMENNVESKVNLINIEEKDLVIIDGKRYYFSSLDASLYEAQVACEEFGMELVSFETQAESDSVWAYIQAQNINYDYHTNGVRVDSNWKWSSTYLNYNNWDPSQPNDMGAGTQNCIHYANGLFWDNFCSRSIHFICEDKVTC